MQVLHGEAMVSMLVEGVVHKARKGNQGHMEDMQVLLHEEEKLVSHNTRAR